MSRILESKWYCAFLSGILLGLSFPPFDLPFLAILGFALLFQLTVISQSYRELASMSFLSFLIWNTIVSYWLMMASLGAGLAAITANSLLMIIPLGMMRFILRRFENGMFNIFVVSFIWVFYEFLHHRWELSWPWLTLGNAWSNYPELIQYISFTGFLGISFWTVFVAAFLFYFINDSTKTYLIGGITALLIFPLLSVLKTAFYVPPLDPPTMEVAVIQPNFDSYNRFGGYQSQSRALDEIMAVSDSTRTEKTELIIWPENSIDTNVRLYSRTTNRIADSARVWDSNMMVGSGFVKEYVDELPEIYREDNDFKYNIFNSSIFITPNSDRSVYEKHNLVPVVERFPFANFLSNIDRLGMFKWDEITGFGKGREANNFTVDSNFITPGLVCYDSVFPHWVGEFVRGGASFITIITNDGWWGDTSGHHQHFAYARLRAIEFDRWVIRSANNGFSGIIAPDGSVKVKTNYWERTGFTYQIESKRSKTFYARYGDWLALFGGLLSVLVWLYGYFKDPMKSVSQS